MMRPVIYLVRDSHGAPVKSYEKSEEAALYVQMKTNQKCFGYSFIPVPFVPGPR